MSYYYEFETKELKLRKDTPADVVELLDSLINKEGRPDSNGLDHPLFKTDRWRQLFYTTQGFVKSFRIVNGAWRLKIHADVNYGHREIELFVEWIGPHVIGHKPKEYIGWSEEESRERPRLNHYIIRQNKVSE